MDIISIIPAFGGLLWTLLAFIVALSIIVAVHEYGHYIVGRWSGIHADVFSIGFGPVLYSRYDKRGTRWQIAALPFGGYVKFAGDANAASGKDESAMAAAASDPAALRRTMHGAPLWARTATVAAGPVFNFVMSILIFGAVAMSAGQVRDPLTVGELRALPGGTGALQEGDVLLSVGGIDVPGEEVWTSESFLDELPSAPTLDYRVERDGAVRIVEGPYLMPPVAVNVTPGSAALEAGLERGDVITAVDGTPIYDFEQLRAAVEGGGGAPLALTVWRDGETLQKTMTPKRTDEPAPEGGFRTQWRIGVASGWAFELATEAAGPVAGFERGVTQTWSIITGTFSGVSAMISGQISTCNLSGPIGIAQTSGAMASAGFVDFLFFIAVISTAIGLFNLFPIPALDGGHLVFYAYEAVTGRPPSDGALRILMATGLALVLSLMVFALTNDIVCP
ncbi:MAG: RIP metalloprotease RseP [Pseudomonadota bacterium]